MNPAVTTIVRVGTWALIGLLAALGLITVGVAVVMPTLVAAGVGALVGWAAAQRLPRFATIVSAYFEL